MSYTTRPGLRSLVPSIVYLIRGASFRPRHVGDEDSRRAGGFSLQICPLSQLVDMYHTRGATINLDKVYALLGMGSDGPYPEALKTNYNSSWKHVFHALVDWCLPSQPSVISTWEDREVAVIEAKGCILGQISSVSEDAARHDMQRVEIVWRKNAPNQWAAAAAAATNVSHLSLQASAKAIKKGDLVFLLRGTSSSAPIIVRLCDDGFSAIIIKVFFSPIRPTDDLPAWVAAVTAFPNDLLLVWDWAASESEDANGQENYESLVTDRGLPECPGRTTCQCQVHLDQAVRLWNFGLVLNGLGRCRDAIRNLQKAVEVYRVGAGLRSADTTMNHSAWRECDANVLGVLKSLFADSSKGLAIETRYKENRQVPLSWAAREGHEEMVKMLVSTTMGDADDDVDTKDLDGRTPLWWAAEGGHHAVVALLVATGKVDIDVRAGGHGCSPLLRAAMHGHGTTVELLLGTGEVDVDVKDASGWTPLWWAANNGHDVVVAQLLAAGAAVDVDTRGYGCKGSPLLCAAKNSHEVAVRLLLATAKADVNAEDTEGQTPLLWAVKNRSQAIVQLLLATGEADVNAEDTEGQTPLLWAAEHGDETVVELLLAKEQIGVPRNTTNGWVRYRKPLFCAMANGHEATVKLILSATPSNSVSRHRYYFQHVQRVLLWAVEREHRDITELLLADCPDVWLWWAVDDRHRSVVEAVLGTSKIDINKNYRHGPTLLSLAAERGDESIVKLLLAREEIDIDGRDS